MHLEQVHTPWRPGKAELARRARLRRRIQGCVHEAFVGGGVTKGVAEDDILGNVPAVRELETRDEYKDRLLKHYLGHEVWDRDGKTRDIFYEPTEVEKLKWSERLLEIAREVELKSASKTDPNISEKQHETKFVEAGYDRHGNKSQSYKESLPPFIKAASDGNLDLLQSMVKDTKMKSRQSEAHHDVIEALVGTRDRNGSTAEHWAAGNGHLECLKYLMTLSATSTTMLGRIDYSHEKSAKRRRKRDGKTSLHYAARNGHTHIVKYLLDSCCPQKVYDYVNVESGDGTTPLHLACYGGHMETIQYLIERNADIYKTNEWNCGIGHWLAMSIQPDPDALISILKFIKEIVKDDLFEFFGRAQKQGHTSVHKAAQKLNRPFLEWLASEVKSSNWTERQREEAGKEDAGGHKPSDIWLQMGGSEEFSLWMREHCGW